MAKIELTDVEYQMLVANINGDFFPPEATDEEKAAMTSVIEKADKLMAELDAYDEMGESLMEWFMGKYQAQQANA